MCRTKKIIEYNGEELTYKQIAGMTGVKENTVQKRINSYSDWDIEQAVKTNKVRNKNNYKGKDKTEKIPCYLIQAHQLFNQLMPI